MIVGIIARSDLKAAGRVLGELLAFLNARHARCIVETDTALLLDGPKDGFSVASGAEMGREADVLVVFGGDGTLLRASHLVASNETLVLGVNFGSLGFLTEIATDELEATLIDVLAGNARFENRSMLSAAITRG
jgi:NAD+ kinase